MSLIRLEQVHKHFGNVQALRGISLNLEPGEVLGLFGHNGAGKTTSMKLILGLERPSQGNIQVTGARFQCSDSVSLFPDTRNLNTEALVQVNVSIIVWR